MSCELCQGRASRRPSRWTWGGLTAVVVAVTAAVVSGQRPRTVEAQSLRAAPTATHVYRQSNVLWTRIAETINEWGEKGWEPYQVIPVASSNPGSGAPMQAAILFRRPAADARR